MLLSWIDVACVREMGNPWTIFFFIVMWLLLCEVLSLAVLGCLDLCLDELSTCLRVGGSLEGRRVMRCGK
jgi:hypothetical protein